MEMERGSGAAEAAPGWYADPTDPRTQRYWDGKRWTESRSPAATAVAPPTNGKAIAAMVLGILWLCGIGSVLALIFGYMGKQEIDDSGGVERGRGMAVAGIVLGWVGVGGFLLWMALYIAGIATLSLSTT